MKNTADQTGTLWVIFMTPKKNILTKISSLKRYGKLKIEELKVMYGKKSVGGWIFQVLGQPASKTFSFHDGDVLRKSKVGYVPLRKHGLHVYFIFCGVLCLWLCGSTIVHFAQNQPKVEPKHVEAVSSGPATPAKVHQNSIASKATAAVIQKSDPEAHERFLEAKKEFQYGHMSASLKIFQKNMMAFDETDRRQASSMISEMFFLQCEKWRRESDERKAVIACEKAMKFSPHEKSNSFLDLQEQKAKKLYLEGYTMQKFDPSGARKKYALVLQSAKSKSTWRGKAQYQLRKI